MANERTSPAQSLPARPVFPTADTAVAFELVFRAHQESSAAFSQLLVAPPGNAARRDLHLRYREKTAHLLELVRQHNESPLRLPQPFVLPLIANPLVQQTLIEADIVDALGEPAEAARLRDWAVETARQYLAPLELARIRRSIANQCAAEGRFNEALTEFEDVRQLFAAAGEVIQSAQTMLEEAALLEWLGDHGRALKTIHAAGDLMVAAEPGNLSDGEQIAQAVARETKSILAGAGATGEADRSAATWRTGVEIVEREARVRRALGEHDTAANLFQAVLQEYESIGAGPAIEYQLAAIDWERGRCREAGERLKRIEPAFSDGLLSGKVAGLRLLQANVALGLDQPANALQLADKGLAELETHPDDDLAWRLHWRRAQSLRAQGRAGDALAAYAKAAAFVDSLRKSPLGYRLDSTALSAKLPLMEEAIAFACDNNDALACLQFIELVKARALSSALSVPPAVRTSRSDLEIEFDRVTQLLDAIEYRGYSGTANTAEVQQNRAALFARRIELVEQIRLRDPRWRGLTAAPPFDAKRLAAALKKRKQAALTLHLHAGIVYSVLIANSRFEVSKQVLDPDVLEIVNEYARSLLLPVNPYPLEPADLQLDAARFVSPELLEKALSASSLLVAPHGQLHLLPWPSLPFGEQRLFARTPVAIVPNLTCALALDYKPAKRVRLAIAGVSSYPGLSQIEQLPATGAELKAVAAMYAGRLVAPPLLDQAATESAVRVLAMRQDAASAILHLSCHGTLSVAADPLGSGLLLCDGKLDAAEWAQMRLQYAEVVLSACSTGWRPQTAQGVTLHGDDVLGLPGALLEAGVRSVLVSIPKASDTATEAFMTAYHRHRAAGTPPLLAFCQTQREMLAGGHKPHTWSGLVFYGVC